VKRSPAQAKYLDAIGRGENNAGASAFAGVTKWTGYSWRKDKQFKTLVAEAVKNGPSEKPDSIPVSPEVFLDSPRYLGKAGTIWPTTRAAFLDFVNGDYYCLLDVSSIGAGKTYLAQLIIAWQLYLLSTMPDPHAFFGLDPDTALVVAVQSRTSQQAKENAFESIKAMLGRSPYFAQCFPYSKKVTADRLKFPNRIELRSASASPWAILGSNPFCCFLDEAAFGDRAENSLRADDLDGTYDQARAQFNAALVRQKSRFYRDGRLHSVILVASSPRTVDDFTTEIRKAAETDKGIFVRKLSIWQAKPGHYDGAMFTVDPGSDTENPRIIRDGETLREHEQARVISIPVALRKDFERDLSRALADLAAVPVRGGARRFFGDPDIVARALRRPSVWSKASIVSGEMVEFIAGRLSNPYAPRVAAIDASLRRDATGIAIGHVAEFVRQGSEYRPRIVIDGTLQVKPPRNGEISWSLIVELICDLRTAGVNVRTVVGDQFGGPLLVRFRELGFSAGLVSVDRGTDAYMLLRSLLADDLVELPNHDVLRRELLELEIDAGRDKIDHPAGGRRGSKDVSDAVAAVTHTLARSQRLRAEHGISPSIASQVTQLGQEQGIDFRDWATGSSFYQPSY
jgi:hypothetical protein